MTLAEQLRAAGVKSQHQQNLEAIIEKVTDRLKTNGQTALSFASGWRFQLDINCFDTSYMDEIAQFFSSEGLKVSTNYAWQVYTMKIYLSNN